MKIHFTKLLLSFFLTLAFSFNLSAQTYFYFQGESTDPSPCWGGSDYTLYTTINLTGVLITSIDYDDGISNGSFHFKVYFTYSNHFEGTIGTESANFYNYQVSMYTENPNVNSNVITNSAGNTIPIAEAVEDSVTLGNNPQFNGSASAHGVAVGQLYTDPDSIAFLGYDSIRLIVQGPCLAVDIASSGTVLNVALGKLTAQPFENGVKIQWFTYKEENNAGFLIEKSNDGINWNTLGQIASKAPEGNSQKVLHYQYNDLMPFEGNNFFRLVQIDNDGKKTFSNIAQVVYAGHHDILIYPLPCSDVLNVKTNSKETSILKLINMAGSTLLKKEIQNGLNHINTADIPNGLYFLHIGKEYYKVVISH